MDPRRRAWLMTRPNARTDWFLKGMRELAHWLEYRHSPEAGALTKELSS